MRITPLTRRRWQQFQQNRRAWWSLWLLAFIFAISLGAELIANDKPLLVSYQGQLFSPLLKDVPETALGGDFETPAVFRDPAVQAMVEADGWLLWPMIRFNAQTIHFERAEPTPSAPSRENWLGTDDQGRDVMARLIYGVRTSLAFASLMTLATVVLGIAAGAAQGYWGGWVDLIGQRFTEIWSGLPVLFMLIILSSLVTPNFWWLLGLLALFSWTDLSGLVRAEFLRTRQLDYVRAARAMGVSPTLLVWRHVLPNALITTLTLLPFIFTGAIGLLTSLDFLGFGLPPGSASLGELIAQGKNNLQAPWLGLTAFFSLSILLTLLVFIGEGLRDAPGDAAVIGHTEYDPILAGQVYRKHLATSLTLHLRHYVTGLGKETRFTKSAAPPGPRISQVVSRVQNWRTARRRSRPRRLRTHRSDQLPSLGRRTVPSECPRYRTHNIPSATRQRRLPLYPGPDSCSPSGRRSSPDNPGPGRTPRPSPVGSPGRIPQVCR